MKLIEKLVGNLIEKLKALYCKFEEQITYLLFGGLTTLVNIVSFYLLSRLFKSDYTLEIAVWLAWFLSVVFAYLTNRKWVFKSTATQPKALAKELGSFFGARLASGVFDYLFMALTVRVFSLPQLAMKIVSNVVVVIFNYFFSKFVVFSSSQKKE